MMDKWQVREWLREAEYVSFDLFDTLLLRLVRVPSQIFDKMYEAAPDLFPEHIGSCQWRHMRACAEKRARERKKGEVTLEEIYRELPSVIKMPHRIMEREIRTERENTFLNPEMEALLLEIKRDYRKKVILTSDMYLSKEHVLGILQDNGMDPSLLDEVFISSECGAAKRDGSLFSYISRKLDCKPDKILHIGDNWKADYRNAGKAGWRSIYYPMISEAHCRHPYLEYEKEFYGDIGREIYAMRILAADSSLEGEAKEWFEMGAMTLGPLLTYGAEWVLDLAEERNIHNIYPMMREGSFLSVLLRAAAGERNWQGRIEPMYVSRRALCAALRPAIKQKDIRNILDAKYMTVGSALELLGLDFEHREYLREYKDFSLLSCKEIDRDGVSLYRKIVQDLTGDEVVRQIRTRYADADLGLWEYLVSLKMDREDYITFDLGWKGTSQNALERICRRRNGTGRGIHLLVIERIAMLKAGNLEEGADIRGFTGNMWGNYKRNGTAMDVLYELFLMCGEGSTRGYEWRDGEIRPLCGPGCHGEELKKMEAVQAGILHFQKLYFRLKKGRRKIPVPGREELYKIAVRLSVLPTRREAELIGSLTFEENFGTDRRWRIIDPEGLRNYARLGYNGFSHQGYERAVEWYEGMDSLLDGLLFYKRAMFHMRESISWQYAMYAERICGRFQRFVLVGAGLRARTLLYFLHLMGETDRVEFLADNDPSLEGERVYGIPVYPVEREWAGKCYCLTSMDRRVVAELTEQLKGMDPESVVYTMDSQE